MKLRVIGQRSGAVFNEADVAIGGYAVSGYILVEFTSVGKQQPEPTVYALTLTPDEAADLAASLNEMAVLRLHRKPVVRQA